MTILWVWSGTKSWFDQEQYPGMIMNMITGASLSWPWIWSRKLCRLSWSWRLDQECKAVMIRDMTSTSSLSWPWLWTWSRRKRIERKPRSGPFARYPPPPSLFYQLHKIGMHLPLTQGEERVRERKITSMETTLPVPMHNGSHLYDNSYRV